MLTRQYVEVPEREPEKQDVVEWLNGTAVPMLVADHESKSPLCRPKKFSEVGIPVSDATEHVGRKVRS